MDRHAYQPRAFHRMRRKENYPRSKACIYCGSTKNPDGLTLEHVIPEGLGGRLTIPHASCDDCQRQIEKFEGRLMNDAFAGARAILEITSKRSKPRTKVQLLKMKPRFELAEKKYVDKSFHNGTQLLFQFGPARFLHQGQMDDSGGFGVCIKSIGEQSIQSTELGSFLTTAKIDLAARLDAQRLLAKIAHSYWVAESPTSEFYPYLVDFILGKSDREFGLFVGDAAVQPIAYADLHRISHGILRYQSHTIAFVDIHLFSCFPPAHSYRVYVGCVGRPTLYVQHKQQSLHPVADAIRCGHNP